MSAGYNEAGMGPMNFNSSNPFAGALRGPAFRNNLSEVPFVSPNFQQMGAGAPSPLMEHGFGMLRDAVGGWAGMPITPRSSASSYLRSRQQQADIARIVAASRDKDTARAQPFFQNMANAMYGATEDPRKVRTLANRVTSDYIGFVSNPVVQAMGGGAFEDLLVPGGLTSSLSTRMYTAGLSTRTGPGQFGIGADKATQVANYVSGQMEKRGRTYARGFNMRELGEISQGMSQRGALDFAASPEMIERNLTKTAGAMSALKDLIGRPDAPIAELFNTIDSMFGPGAMLAMSPEKMEGIIRRASIGGRRMGLTPTQTTQMFRAATLQAEGLGMYGAMGAISLDRSMGGMTAAASMSEERQNRIRARAQAEGRVELGLETKDQVMARTQEFKVRTMDSVFANKMAAAINLQGMTKSGKFEGPRGALLNRIIDKVKRKEPVSPEESTQLFEAMQGGNFAKIAEQSGVDMGTFSSVMGMETLLQSTKASYDLSEVQQLAYKGQMVGQMSQRVQGSKLLKEALGLQGLSQAEKDKRVRAFINKDVLDKAGGDYQGLVDMFMKEKGLNKADASAAAMQMIRIGSDTLGSQWGRRQEGRLGALADTVSTEAINRRRQDEQTQAAEAAYDEAFNIAGFGQAKGGAAGMIENFIRSYAEGDGDISDTIAKTLGGVETSRLRGALQTKESRKQLEKIKTTQREMASIRDILASGKEGGKALSPERRKELEAELRDKGVSLQGSMKVLQDYSDLVNTGAAAQYQASKGEASRFGILAEEGSQAALLEKLEKYANLDKSSLAESAKSLPEEKQKEYYRKMDEIQKIAIAGTDATTKEGRKKYAGKMQELLTEVSDMFGLASGSITEEDIKKRVKEKAGGGEKGVGPEIGAPKSSEAIAEEGRKAGHGGGSHKVTIDGFNKANQQSFKFTGTLEIDDRGE